MNKLLKHDRPSPRSRRSARRTWGLYLLALAAWVTAVIAMAFLGAWFLSSFIWQDTPLYRFLQWVRDYIFFVCMLVVLAGWVVISYFFIARPTRDLELLLSGAEQLANPGEEPIRLPDSLKDAEGQLNRVREQALHNVRAARDAEQRKNDLVVYLSHDLKTPLTSVIGYLTLLRDEPQLSPELRARYTNVALDKAERLEELVNEFFDITRFSLTHLELERQRVDLRRMLEQVASELAPVLTEKGMDCVLSLPPVFTALCDPDKMARVFDNLLNNAFHYGYPDSAIEIDGWTEGEALVLTFRNAGPAIPPEKLERMFEQFFRLDSSRASRTGGAGLGLAIAREIVEAHGGSISAESRGEQVVFTVILPASGPS